MPSSHSGSSHSSSSSSRSSSHSSSSRSSSSSWSSSSRSSSWGSSSRSSSWGSSSRSSYDSSGSSSGGFLSALFSPPESDHTGPSPHSGSTRRDPTIYRSRYVSNGSMRGSIIDRPRSNQPRGWSGTDHSGVMPILHYCRKHNYEYYPSDWTDTDTGTHYEKGYYDENGKHYEDVAFLCDGKYKNVLCKCEYCDTVSKLDWEKDGPLICPQCGGTMKLLSELDEYTRDPNYEKNRSIPSYVDYADLNKPQTRTRSRFGLGKILLVILGLVLVTVLAAQLIRQRSAPAGNKPLSNVDIFGSSVYLREAWPGAYVISDGGSYDRVMRWSNSDDSYYDSASRLYLWYNTDVSPNLWQYWYEPISGDYGDYGWMEYEDGTWYIEAERNQWVPVPAKYNTAALWHIEPDETGRPSQGLPIVPVSTENHTAWGDTDEDLPSGTRPLPQDTDEELPSG